MRLVGIPSSGKVKMLAPLAIAALASSARGTLGGAGEEGCCGGLPAPFSLWVGLSGSSSCSQSAGGGIGNQCKLLVTVSLSQLISRHTVEKLGVTIFQGGHDLMMAVMRL